MPTPPEGILLVDKPIGITSFDVIRVLRKKLEIKKMGHAGTLDPLATGLMIIGTGKATKLLHNYIKLPKTYEAEILIGERTTTGDKEGEVLEKKDATSLTDVDIKNALETMVATLDLPVPAFSAIKRGGEALYKKARRGEKVDVPIKPMTVRSATFQKTSQAGCYVACYVTFDVESGVYIRSLAEELGKRLGYPARLENLRRTQVGEFSISEAMNLD